MKAKSILKLFTFLTMTLAPALAFASLQTSVAAITAMLSQVILPALAVISLLFAGFSFMTQNQNCKMHLLYSVIGILISAGASLLFNFVNGIIK